MTDNEEEDNMRLQTMRRRMTKKMVMIRNRMKMIMTIMDEEMESWKNRPVSLTLLLGCCSQIEGCPTYDLWDSKKNF